MKQFISPLYLLSIIFLNFFIVAPIFAATITLQSNQNILGPTDEFTVNANLFIGSANGTQYFLRGAFYADGISNYCGYTYNGSDWYNGPYTTNNGWLNLLPGAVQNSSWSG